MIELIHLLTANGPTQLWCYNRGMHIVNFPLEGYSRIAASGVCPHCSVVSYLRPMGAAYIEALPAGRGNLIANITQCESCKNFALVVGERPGGIITEYRLAAVYPAGKPDDRVDSAVPEHIKLDFAEALRCHWVRAHKAAVVMCRRALEASALEKGASSGKNLLQRVEELADRGVITQPLKQFAHEVRLTGNVGAHPDEDGLENVTDQDAADIIEFTREYFHHVYVMPARLEARRAQAAPAVRAQPAPEGGR